MPPRDEHEVTYTLELTTEALLNFHFDFKDSTILAI